MGGAVYLLYRGERENKFAGLGVVKCDTRKLLHAGQDGQIGMIAA